MYINGMKTPLELGLKVRYEIEPSKYLPKLIEIEPCDFMNCSDCGCSYDISDAQVVSITVIRGRFYCK